MCTTLHQGAIEGVYGSLQSPQWKLAVSREPPCTSSSLKIDCKQDGRNNKRHNSTEQHARIPLPLTVNSQHAVPDWLVYTYTSQEQMPRCCQGEPVKASVMGTLPVSCSS